MVDRYISDLHTRSFIWKSTAKIPSLMLLSACLSRIEQLRLIMHHAKRTSGYFFQVAIENLVDLEFNGALGKCVIDQKVLVCMKKH